MLSDKSRSDRSFFSAAALMAMVAASVAARWNRSQNSPPFGDLAAPKQHTAVDRAIAPFEIDDPPLPEYISGDECLFCHRFETGNSWQENRHNQTIRRPADDEISIAQLRRNNLTLFADEAQFVMGRKSRVRFLRKGAGYGRLDLLTAEVAPPSSDKPASVLHVESPAWDSERFGASCAGCHTTQTDSRTKSFSAISLDCFVCHGNSTLEHTKDKKQMLFARGHSATPRVIVSACAQCHLRGGRSKTTQLPYANNFTAGADAFSDFEFDLAAADDLQLNPGDRHVYFNARLILQPESSDLTCVSCHNVHAQSTVKHRRLARSPICYVCHDRDSARWSRPTYEVHSKVCGY